MGIPFPGISYHFINNTPYDLVITPHVGFFCSGPWVDSYWNGGVNAPFYPVLFNDPPGPGNPKQYGNTIQVDAVKLGPWSSITHGPSTGTFPVNGAHHIGTTGFTDSTNDPNDVHAMMELGKIYFIEYQVPAAGAVGYLKQKFGDDTTDLPTRLSSNPNWQHISPVFPSPSSDLSFDKNMALVYQYTDEWGGPGSMEICLVNYPGTPVMPSEVVIAGIHCIL